MKTKKPLKSDQRFFYTATVNDVYDGDTFTVDIDLGFDMVIKGQKIRLAGVDTPEMRGKEKVKGVIVRDFVRDLILNKVIYIKTIEKTRKGSFGRWIADVYFTPTGKGKSLSESLLEEEYALVFNK